jgi:UDP-N-acetylglucosamine 2-epimerase (non-hydrolysing)
LRLLHVVGARPNFPKLAPVLRAGRRIGVEQIVVHTGQHYDALLSSSFFDDLGITPPDHNLEVGSGTHAVQTARIMERFEPVLVRHRPDWLVVYGDVNSTMATALVAAKLGVRIAHVEAGLRSGDRAMPEEINRIVADRLADLLLTPSRDADEALRREGARPEQIVFVGNVMIDSLLHALPRARATGAARRLGVDGSHVLVTLHRPSNVDDDARLRAIIDALAEIGRQRRVLFPSHPRTAQRIATLGLPLAGVDLIAPLPYHDMVDVMARAHAVITDSGGIQEETTALGVPCFTVRENTERPITITEGTNRLVTDLAALPSEVETVRRPAHPPRPEGWDGCAGERIIQALVPS